MANRFFTPDPLGPGEYIIVGPEAHHLATVRRVQCGDRITLFNGDGRDYPAEVVAVDRKQTVVNVEAPVSVKRELPHAIVVAAALPKGDRLDFLVEKLTELGVARFVPLITERSVVLPKATTVEKLSRAVIEASKQCGRNALMVVDHPQRWSECVSQTNWPAARYVLHTGSTLPSLPSGPGEVAIAVGPEGGFTAAEVGMAQDAGWIAASLGPRVLRVETAALAAAARWAIQ